MFSNLATGTEQHLQENFYMLMCVDLLRNPSQVTDILFYLRTILVGLDLYFMKEKSKVADYLPVVIAEIRTTGHVMNEGALN